MEVLAVPGKQVVEVLAAPGLKHDSLAAVAFVCEAKRGVETLRCRCGVKQASTEAVYCGDGAQTHDAHSLNKHSNPTPNLNFWRFLFLLPFQ